MKSSSKLALLAITGAIAAVSSVDVKAESSDHEKCYGVVKAGSNDCGTSSHGCAGMSEVDGDKSEWVVVPKGLCEKLAGGSLESSEE